MADQSLKSKATELFGNAFSGDSSSRNIFLASASALVVVGASTIGYQLVQSRREHKKKEEIFRTKKRARQQRAINSTEAES